MIQVGDKVRCPAGLGEVTGYFFPHAKPVMFYVQLGDGSYFRYAEADLQYIFQRGDNVKMQSAPKGYAGRIQISDEYVGKGGVFEEYYPKNEYSYPCLVRVDETQKEIYFAEDELILVDRAPKSDAEQCCNQDSDTVDSLRYLGDCSGIAKERHVPGVKCNDPSSDEKPFCFPVDPPAEPEPECENDFEIELTDGQKFHVEGSEVISWTKHTNGAIELITDSGFFAYFSAGSYEWYAGPTNKLQVEVTLEPIHLW